MTPKLEDYKYCHHLIRANGLLMYPLQMECTQQNTRNNLHRRKMIESRETRKHFQCENEIFQRDISEIGALLDAQQMIASLKIPSCFIFIMAHKQN